MLPMLKPTNCIRVRQRTCGGATWLLYQRGWASWASQQNQEVATIIARGSALLPGAWRQS